MKMSAHLSHDGLYRWTLTRSWDSDLPPLCWLMFNPSTADHETNDNTILKVIEFSKRHLYGSAVVGNLYPFRATQPSDLFRWLDASRQAVPGYFHGVMDSNMRALQDAFRDRDVVLAFGANAKKNPLHMVKTCSDLMDAGCKLKTLKLLNGGIPAHPLYLPYSLKLADFIPTERKN